MEVAVHDDAEGEVEPIAVIGMSCRVPGARNITEFWRNLTEGVESIAFMSREEQADAGVPEHQLDDPGFVPAVAVMDDVECFDAAYFGISARDAELRDPQHRVFLELAHAALEDSGYDSARYPGDIGVYAGQGGTDYQWHHVRRNPKAYAAAGAMGIWVGNHADYLATLASYKLNLRGPSMTMQTACSTSLVAVHVACEALRNGECDMALGGGICIDFPLRWGYVYDEGSVFTPDGHCRAFDHRAAGTLWGSGGAVVMLKRLSDAVADRDHIRAVIRGNAINNDGSAKVGFSAPSVEGQVAVLGQALGVAGVDPRTVTYVEAHGTGTALGDPIEVAALSAAFGQDSRDRGWCALGSVKPNIGHLGQAAGIVSLVKAVLAIENGMIPPSLHFEKPNPKIDFASSPFYVNAALATWAPAGLPRRAGVSSFGIGGTNAHMVLEEAPQTTPDRPESPAAHLLRLSARTETALTTLVERLGDHLEAAPGLDLADVAWTLGAGRREHEHRVAVVARDAADAAAALADNDRLISGVVPGEQRRVAFLFSGQGAQYAGMGAGLYRTEPVFRDAVDECCALAGGDLRSLILGETADAAERLRQTERAQPALFAVEYALAALWRSWGVEPAAMIGHSIGEYVAATLAGVCTLPDAMRLVTARGRLMQRMPAGAMLAVPLPAAEVAARLPDGLSIATVNGPGTCVAAGPTPLVAEFAATLAAEGIESRRLHTSHAFHSPMMEPVLGEFRDIVAAVPLRAPRLPFLSNLTGDWITAEEATDPSYWARHLREPVRFGSCLEKLTDDGGWVLVECGPGRQLARLAAPLVSRTDPAPVPSLPGPGEDTTDLDVLNRAAGTLWVAGIAIEGFGRPARRVPLPTYPFARTRLWVDADPEVGNVLTAPDRTRRGPLPLPEWFSVPAWRQEIAGPVPAEPSFTRCLVFADDAGAPLVAALRQRGVEVMEVRSGARYGSGPAGWTIRPSAAEDYAALLADLGAAPERIVHAWTVDTPPAGADPELACQAQDRGFYSLLALVQALAAVQPSRVHIDVVTAGTQDVTGGDLVRPEHATVAGIAKVVPLEAGWLTVRHVDTEDGLDGRAVGTEVLREPQGEVVVLRGGRRWRQSYEPVPVPAETADVWRQGGVYLITGGIGGIGITIAEDIATRAQGRLVLISRSGLDGHTPAGVVAAIERMERAGAQVLVLAADVTSEADMRRVRQETLDRFGRLDGIVHAAGLPGAGMAEIKERAAADKVLAPKLRGTLVLRAVFGDLDLDVVVLCSSVTAVTGGFGQVDYCAANSFQDAHARADHGWRARVVSVNWGGWLEVGMAAEVSAPAAFRALQRGGRTERIEHPILTSRHEDWCGGAVSPNTHWVLDEHRLAGVAVLPGTAYLELARRAFEEVVPPGPGHLVELRDVAFVEPLAVADGRTAELKVLLRPGVDGHEFEVLSLLDDRATVHARGAVGWTDAAPAPVVDIEAARDRCNVAQDPGALTGLLTFGPRWGGLKAGYLGAGEALARLEAPGVVVAEQDRWPLHPALLDEATAFARVGAGSEGHYLPLGYGRLLIRAPLPARVWSHVRYRDSGGEVIAADVSLVDDAGNEVLAISDFVLRRVDGDGIRDTVQATTRAPAGSSATPAAAAGPAAEGIRPAEGAAALGRVLAAEVGPQVVISARALDRLIADTQALTQETIETSAGSVAAPAGPGGGGYVAPRTELEATLAGLWGEILGGEPIGVDDDFFRLGGNSLVAVQLTALIRKLAGVRLPMQSLFEAPTVAELAALIEQERVSAAAQQVPDEAAIPRLPRTAGS